jgi:protein gp37
MSKIEWTDETWNGLAGCTKVSPGCDHCYAERMALRHSGNYRLPRGTRDAYRLAVFRSGGRIGFPGCWSGKVVPIPGAVERLAAKCASWRKPRRIFIQSMGDLFHDQVPFELVARLFAIFALFRRHTFQLLTKRPDNMQEVVARVYRDGLTDARNSLGMSMSEGMSICAAMEQGPLPNVWGGATVEDQPRADERIPKLLETLLAVRFVSVEPMLGELDLTHITVPSGQCEEEIWDVLREQGDELYLDHGPALDWVICGGETGPGARKMSPQWAKDLRDQCKASGVPFFFKKMGSWWGGDNEAPGHLGLDVRQFPQG